MLYHLINWDNLTYIITGTDQEPSIYSITFLYITFLTKVIGLGSLPWSKVRKYGRVIINLRQ